MRLSGERYLTAPMEKMPYRTSKPFHSHACWLFSVIQSIFRTLVLLIPEPEESSCVRERTAAAILLCWRDLCGKKDAALLPPSCRLVLPVLQPRSTRRRQNWVRSFA